MRGRQLQLGITVAALLIAVAHLLWPNLTIDEITLILFVIAIVPWLAPLFKSLEFPGGMKIEFQDLQRARIRADDAGLLAARVEMEETPQYSFQMVADEDPNLALAGLRIEIERRLVQLAESRGLEVRRAGVGGLLKILSEKDVLTSNERGVLADMVSLLNSAVHGAEVDDRGAEWAMEIGPRLLKALDERIAEMALIKLNIDMEYGRREPVEFVGKEVATPVVKRNFDGTKGETYTEYWSKDGHHVAYLRQWRSDKQDDPVRSSLKILNEPDVEPWPIEDKTVDPHLRQPLTLDQALTYSQSPLKGWLD